MKKTNGQSLEELMLNRAMALVENQSLSRADMVKKLFDPRRDINAECGYPDDISPEEYKLAYDREGLGRRVVEFWPEESWVMDPDVFETEDPEKTEFEEAWDALQKSQNVYFQLHRIDVLSGIGRFGVLLLGLDDSKEFKDPVEGLVDGDNKPLEKPTITERKLLYLRAFDESVAVVDQRDNDPQSTRFGQPTIYTLSFEESESIGETGGLGISGGTVSRRDMKVHWTRVIHIADNRETSEIFGTPRMQVVFNRVMDARKVLSGSGEMFWKGAFPGYSLESQPGAVAPTADGTKKLREQIDKFFNGLQRIIATTGFSIKSLAPQISDPSKHMEAIMDNVAFTLGVPKRKFMGSEQAQLASVQDTRTFNNRVAKRQNNYLTPLVVRPFTDRMIAVGVLPEVESYEVTWPDLNTVTDKEKAEVARVRTEALAKYVQGGVDQLVPPEEFLAMFLGLEPEEVAQIMKAAAAFQEELDAEIEEELRRNPPLPGDEGSGGAPRTPEDPSQGGVENAEDQVTTMEEDHTHTWRPKDPRTSFENGHNHKVDIVNGVPVVLEDSGANGNSHIHTGLVL